jgi:hypothetical protein
MNRLFSGIKLSTITAGLMVLAFNCAQAVQTPGQLTTNIINAAQGDVISLDGINPLYCPEADMSQTWQAGGELIFSDSPESPTSRGILYEDGTQPGNVTNRIFAYHVNNQSSGNLRFSVLIENLGSSYGTLQVQQVGSAGPSTSYGYIGKLAFDRWLTSSQGTAISVAPGQTVRLDTNFDSTLVSPGNLLHGIWDYSFTQPHKVIICAINPSDNPLSIWPSLSVLARDTHERGTYAACNKMYDTAATFDTTNGISLYPIGDHDLDTPTTGYDYAVTPPTAETHLDPSGILYRTHLTLASSDGRSLAILINPRGGSWGGAVYAQSGILPGGKFLVPSGSGSTSDNTKGTVEGDYATPSGTVFMQFMPTGGSNFPVDIMLVPHP